MESIVIFKATSGESLLLTPQKGIDLRSVTQTKKIMEQDTIAIDLMSVSPLNIGVGDYLRNEKGAITHRLITPPEIEKIGSRKYSYHLTFEGAIYELNNFIYTNQGDSRSELLPTSEFYFSGNLKDFLSLLQRSTNKYHSEIDNPYSWVLIEESIPQTNVKTLNFNNESCLSALKKIADAFKVEFDVIFKPENNNYEWRFLKVLDYQSDRALTLKYGKYSGLKSLRTTPNKETQPNVLRYYGAKKNLPPLYRDRHGKIASRLLPNGVDEPMIMDGWIDQIEMIIEKNHFFDDIFPQYLGSITGTGKQSRDILQFSDYKIDFPVTPINDNTKMKINFKTGNLAGYTFDIREVQAGGTVIIEQKQDDNGVKIPNNDTTNSPFMWAVGDEFVLIDIQMPQEYIRKAEERLAKVAEKDFKRRTEENLSQIEVSLYEPYFKRKQLKVATNDFFRLEDEDLGISDTYRVLKVTTDLVRNNKFTPYDTKVELEKWTPKLIEAVESAVPSIQVLANATKLPAYVVGDSYTFEKLEDYLYVNFNAEDRLEDDIQAYYEVYDSIGKKIFDCDQSETENRSAKDGFYIKPRKTKEQTAKPYECLVKKDGEYTIKVYYNNQEETIIRKITITQELSIEQSSVDADLFIYQCKDNQTNYKDCELRKDGRISLDYQIWGAGVMAENRKQYSKVMLNFGEYFKSSGSYKWKIVRDDGRFIVDTISHTDFYYIKDGDIIDDNFFKVGNSYTVYCQFRGGKKPMTSLTDGEDIVLRSHFTIVKEGFRKGVFK
ncbi:hypothetical protein [Ornithobacterium rhinotracheale]|uniref:hypothetical protein n=1 Tax=Ornithobacterium rhinotracheale TaxID=28251 RepID=UPI001FF56197|nr:hypothetical protein [Ornithobacterium rhinotracheale]MCK0201359.1 hypothetical protein [Ornithobacterium rhinotracheale]